MPFDVQEIRDRNEFLELKDQWNDLLARSDFDSPFLRHEWIATWWEHFAAGERVSILIIRDDGRLVLALPLIETTQGKFGMKVLRSMTNTHSFRFHYIIEQSRDDLMAELWDYLRRRPGWQLLIMTDIPLDVRSTEETLHGTLIQHVRRHGGLAEIWPAMDSAFIHPDQSWMSISRVSRSPFANDFAIKETGSKESGT